MSIDLNKQIGILGGGQLGRMIIQEAINYNISLHILDKKGAPCEGLSSNFKIGDITNFEDVMSFGENLDFLSIEIENVNTEALHELEKKGVKVHPQPRIIELIQDKGLQKVFYQKNGIPTANFSIVEIGEHGENAPENFPYIQKMRTGGYDGKGVQVIRTQEDLIKGFSGSVLIEDLIPFKKEISVIVARNKDGETAVYPTVEQEFNPEANLVEFLFSPADISPIIEEKAKKIACSIVEKLDMIGLLAVELFLTENDELLVNEIAPRPHNSGHHTIECNVTSQFEQHLRSILNFPLGDTKIVTPGVMINLLGDKDSEGIATYVNMEEGLNQAGVNFHLYGKTMTKPFRKMGHITVINEDLKTAKEIARNLKNTIKVIGK